MEKWYCREPISSTVAASQIVFNINNCVNKSRVIQSRPTRPPDSKGRECYVYVLDGSFVRNIRDLPIDDLAPWNSKMCKSSTRFNAVSLNPQRGDMVMRRYIVSDTDNVPECLLACYYCKHPTFKLAKKIFYACDGRREACLPGSYVVFIYEFEGMETLYQRTYQNGSANRQPSGPRRHLTAAATASLNSSSNSLLNGSMGTPQSTGNGTLQKRPYGSISDGDDLSQSRNGLEAIMNATNNNSILTNNNNTTATSIDETLSQLFGNDVKFEDIYTTIFENLNNNNNENKALAALPRITPTPNASNGSGASGAKRRKVSSSLRINYSPVLGPPALAKSRNSEPNDIVDFRFVYTSEAMLDNFRHNGLCDPEKFANFCDSCVENHESMIDSAGGREFGGCVLLEPTFECGRYFFTVLWFRNPTFLLGDAPAVQPAAIMVSGKKQPDDYKFLLNDIQSKVQSSGRSVRAVLAPESMSLDEYNGTGGIFTYPCVRLNCVQDFLKTLPVEDLSEVFSVDLFDTVHPDSLLNAIRFEDFVCRLGQLEKKWPAGLRAWFREKSGWVFERLSYSSRLKAGFTSKVPATLKDLLDESRTQFIQRFNALIESSQINFGLFAAVSALDELTNEIFVRSAQAIFSEEIEQSPSSSVSVKITVMEEEEEECELTGNQLAGPSSSSSSCNDEAETKNGKCGSTHFTLHPSLRSSCMSRLQWRKCDPEKRQEILTELGLPTILPCEICMDAEYGINPDLFKALNRQERIELLSKAFELEVKRTDFGSSAEQNLQSDIHEESRYIVFDNAEKSYYYVSGNYEKNMSYCQCQKQKIANFSTSVVKTLICEHLCAVALVDELFARTLNASFSSSPPVMTNNNKIGPSGLDNDTHIGSDPVDSSSVDSSPSKQFQFPIKLEGPSGVEIIRFSTQSNDGDDDNKPPVAAKPNASTRNGGNVHNIIKNLHNRGALKNREKSTEVPPMLQPFDSNCSALENAMAISKKLIKDLPSIKLEGENFTEEQK